MSTGKRDHRYGHIVRKSRPYRMSSAAEDDRASGRRRQDDDEPAPPRRPVTLPPVPWLNRKDIPE